MYLGSDPELFLKRDGNYVSAIGLIGGTKDKPRPIKTLGKGFAIQEDNVLLEYNTPPVKTMGKWVEVHNKMMTYLSSMLQEKGMTYDIAASVIMPEEALRHPKAMVFGCEPDFNVWTCKINPKPASSEWRLRSAGGHVHIGTPLASNVAAIQLGRTCDAFLGLWSVINDPDERRKELYGKAGSIRFKPYGIEYRVMSNFWLKNEDLTREVWRLADLAVVTSRENWKPGFLDKVRTAIDKGDKAAADLLLEKAHGCGW